MTHELAALTMPQRVERYAGDGHLPTPNGAVGNLGGFATSIDKHSAVLRDAGYSIPDDPHSEFRITGVGTWDGASYDGAHSPRLDVERIVGTDGTPTLAFTRRDGEDISIVTLKGYRGGHSWDGYTVFSRVGGRDFAYTSDQAREDSRILGAPYSPEEKRGRGERLGHAAAVVGDIVYSLDNSGLDRAMHPDGPKYDRAPSHLEGVVGVSEHRSYHTSKHFISRMALKGLGIAKGIVRDTRGSRGTGRVRI